MHCRRSEMTNTIIEYGDDHQEKQFLER